ncbi:MAG TPA: anhydro-N-acetylmuramic acid kinase [Sphingobacteriaceae bacterium]
MISKLVGIAEKPARVIVGLMSGTSLDGLDVALCRIGGSGVDTRVELLNFETIGYAEEFRQDVRSVFSKRSVDLEKVCLLNALIGRLHGRYINECLVRWGVSGGDVDAIASHGQTIYHAPERLHQLAGYPNATLQIGDGDHIAVATGILTLSDFRQKHIAAGGEGAPLALYGDYLMFTSTEEDRILLNMGGISNFTYLPKDGDTGRIISTDVGPGNTLIDALMQKYFDLPYDKDSRIAKRGTVNNSLLEGMLKHPFFGEGLPKTTGPELFNMAFIEGVKADLQLGDLRPEDMIATVTYLTAKSIALQITGNYGNLPLSVYTSGGGAHNPMVIEELERMLPACTIRKADVLGINGDAKEAVLFAVLANETLTGSAVKIGNAPGVTMGKISFPG